MTVGLLLQKVTCLRNEAALSEKLQILAAPLRFIALSAVNPRRPYTKHTVRNYSLLAIFLSVTVNAHAHTQTIGYPWRYYS